MTIILDILKKINFYKILNPHIKFQKLNLEFSLKSVGDFCLQTIIYIMDLVCL